MTKSEAIEAIKSGHNVELRSPGYDPPRPPSVVGLDSDGELVVYLAHERSPVPAPESNTYGIVASAAQIKSETDEYVAWAASNRYP